MKKSRKPPVAAASRVKPRHDEAKAAGCSENLGRLEEEAERLLRHIDRELTAEEALIRRLLDRYQIAI